MAIWDGVVPEEDLETYRRAGWGHPMGVGDRAALVIVDVTYNFCGSRRAPLEEAIAESTRSCGESAWDAIPVIATLKSAFEARGLPVIYTTGVRSDASESERGRWVDKNPTMRKPSAFEAKSELRGEQVVADIAPGPESIVISKLKPSAFFGTPLVGHLQYLGVDTVVVTGTTTSGCVRATAIDAFSYNYRVVVVEDAVFDRGRVSHAVNLFDIQQKYGDVMDAAALIKALDDRSTDAGPSPSPKPTQ